MKIYWVRQEGCRPIFFVMTEKEAQESVRFFNEEWTFRRGEKFSYYDEEIPESEFGWCANGANAPDGGTGETKRVLPYQLQCSVGMVRAVRDVGDDDGCCGSCPYYRDAAGKE